jgi:hypothetical protein
LGRRTPKKWWCFFFSNLNLDFENWTFIFVHFWKVGVDFWKKHRLCHSEHNALNCFFKMIFLLP